MTAEPSPDRGSREGTWSGGDDRDERARRERDPAGAAGRRGRDVSAGSPGGSGGAGPLRPDRVVIPGERRRERRGRRLRALLVLLAVAVAGGLLLLSDVDVPGWVRSAVEDARSGGAGRTGSPAGAAATGEAGGGSAAPAGDAPAGQAGDRPASPPGDSALRRLGDRADALGDAIRRFRERADDFDRGRIGCAALAEGYGRVDRVMVDLARAYVDVRQRAGPGDEALFQRAMARADSAGRAFDATGCPRSF